MYDVRRYETGKDSRIHQRQAEQAVSSRLRLQHSAVDSKGCRLSKCGGLRAHSLRGFYPWSSYSYLSLPAGTSHSSHDG